MKLVKVKDEIWQKLTIMKAEKMASSLNEVIEYLIKRERKWGE